MTFLVESRTTEPEANVRANIPHLSNGQTTEPEGIVRIRLTRAGGTV